MTTPNVHVFPTIAAASRALAEAIDAAMHRAHAERDIVTLALSGGSTPRALHELLAEEHPDLPWSETHVFWGDDRWVPLDSQHSNFRMARETLLDQVPIPPGNVHPWNTGLPTPADTIHEMEGELERFFDGSNIRFDVMIMGIGEDGHTASLFPASPALRITDRPVAATTAPDEPRERVTFTLPVINNAREVHFLVEGASKREALSCALADLPDPMRCPASMVRPKNGTLTWWLDREVAATVVDQ